MPENTNATDGANNSEADDLRARFAAHLGDEEPAVSGGQSVELPPVPETNYARPNTQAAREAAPGQIEGRPLGGGIGSRGLIGSTSDVKGSAQALTIGTQLVGSIIAGTLLGWLADKYLLHSGATPWGLIVGFMLGVASGFVNLVRVANRLNKD